MKKLIAAIAIIGAMTLSNGIGLNINTTTAYAASNSHSVSYRQGVYKDFEYIEAGTDYSGNPGIKITKYNGTDKAVKIPSRINNRNVVGLYANAFKNCTMETIDIPNTVNFIGESCFENCTNLHHIYFPRELQTIQKNTFKNCTSLVAALLRQDTELKTVEEYAFDGCTSLNEDEFLVLENYETTKINKQKITIKSHAFNNCTNLVNITIPEYYNLAGEGIFSNCKNLDSITLSAYTINVSSAKVFSGASNLSTIFCYKNQKLPTGLTYRIYYIDNKCDHNNYDYAEKIETPKNSKTVCKKLIRTYKCNTCGVTRTEVESTTKHKFNTKTVKPTTTAKGYTLHTCADCGYSYKDSYVNKLIDIKSANITVSSVTYTGKAVTPKVTVKLGNTTLASKTNYTITCSNNANIGTAKVTIKGVGKYGGSITKTFKIIPKATSFTSLTKNSKSKNMTVKFSKVTNISGYEILYSTSSKFNTGNKVVTVSANSISKTISSLTKGKTYYVKIRTYKTVNGIKYYSGYTTVKNVKI